MINTVYHLLLKNNQGRGGGLNREGVINFLPLKSEEGLLEGGGLFKRGCSIGDLGKVRFLLGGGGGGGPEYFFAKKVVALPLPGTD